MEKAQTERTPKKLKAMTALSLLLSMPGLAGMMWRFMQLTVSGQLGIAIEALVFEQDALAVFFEPWWSVPALTAMLGGACLYWWTETLIWWRHG